MSLAHPTYYKNQLITNLADSTKINYKAYYHDDILFGVNAKTGDTPTEQYYIHYKSSTNDVIPFDEDNANFTLTHPFVEFGLTSNTYDSENDIGTLSFTYPVSSLTSYNTYDPDTYYDGSIFTVNGEPSQDLIEVEIPNTVQIIDGRIFCYNDNLSAVTFEENSQLTEIRNDCFGNTSIRSIELPEGLTTIGRGVIEGYGARWQNIVFPSTLTDFDDIYCVYALRNINPFPTITFRSLTPPSLLTSTSIYQCYGSASRKGTLYVPSESVADYQTAYTTLRNQLFYYWTVSAIQE